MPNLKPLPKEYSLLRRRVEETLLLGRQKIEAAKVQTYRHTGELIHEHIARYGSRSEHYGQQVVKKLEEDLGVDMTTLWRCVQFFRSFKILAARRESLSPRLTWAHYRELITIPDEQTRLSFMRRAEKSGWTHRELARKIREEVKSERDFKGNGDTPATVLSSKLIPRRGELYTYRLIELDPLHKDSDDGNLRVDLGFKGHCQLPDPSKGFKAGQIIESVKDKNGGYEVRASEREEADLFTFKARVERVVDGDTLYVDVDQGFGKGEFQYLRLRGIDAPEIDTPEGKKAKAFVERALAKVPCIILTSSRSDKWDRYLADVFYGEGEQEKYLNQVLLDEGLAERWE